MSQIASKKHIAGLDFLLVMVAVALIFMFQMTTMSPLTMLAFTLCIPIGYLVLTKLMTQANLAEAAGRTYLLCFFSGLLGLATKGSAVLQKLASQINSQTFDGETIFPTMLISAVQLIPHFMTPLLVGIAIFAICSVYESSTTPPASDPKPIIDRLNKWFEESETPEELRMFLVDMHQRLVDLSGGCQGLSKEVVLAEKKLSTVSQAAVTANAAFDQLAQTGARLTGELKQLTGEVVAVGASIDQLQAAVVQIGNVVDEFSEIASKKILEL